MEPTGFFDFVALEQSASCILTDSGTVQEEAAILHRRSVTLRDVTERPETLESGANLLSGINAEAVAEAVAAVDTMSVDWQVPPEYETRNVADATQFAADAQAAFAEAAKLAEAGNVDGASAEVAKAAATCMGCHTAHRERDAAGAWQIT